MVLLAFFSRDRFRIPLAVALIPFAAWTIVCIVQWLASGKARYAAAAILATIVVGIWTSRPLPEGTWLIRPADYWSAFHVYYEPAVEHAEQCSDWARAAQVQGESLRFVPEEVARLGPARPPRLLMEAEFAKFYVQKYMEYARLLSNAGQFAQSAAAEVRARELESAVRAFVRRPPM